MVYALTSEQVEQMVENTLLVLLGRPELLPQWQDSLISLLSQAQAASLDDEAVFIAAVLTLLNYPEDRLPTGTAYDRAWESIMIGVQTGMVQSSHTSEETDQMTLDRLLASVVEAAVAMVNRSPEERKIIQQELFQMRTAAIEANVNELVAWIDDILRLLGGQPLVELGLDHTGVYAVYWEMLRQKLTHNT